MFIEEVSEPNNATIKIKNVRSNKNHVSVRNTMQIDKLLLALKCFDFVVFMLATNICIKQIKSSEWQQTQGMCVNIMFYIYL